MWDKMQNGRIGMRPLCYRGLIERSDLPLPVRVIPSRDGTIWDATEGRKPDFHDAAAGPASDIHVLDA